MITRALRGLSNNLAIVLERSLNPAHGLIHTLMEEPPTRQGLRLVHALIASPTYYLSNAPTKLKTADRGTGASFHREKACWAAIGEALERYAASIYWQDQLLHGSAQDFGDQPIQLNKLIRSGRPEIRLFNPNTRRAWARGIEMISGRHVLVPAAMTYLGYVSEEEHEIITQNDSTGLACGRSLNNASLNALCELVERDVFASTWLLSRRPPKLELGMGAERLDFSVRLAVGKGGISVELFYLGKAFGVHAVVCLVTSKRGHGIVAAAASPFILTAIEKAVCEGLYTWTLASRHIGQRKMTSVDEIKAPSDHVRYYLHPERFEIVRRQFSADESVQLTDLLTEEAGHVVALDVATSMFNQGIVASQIDVTTPDVAALGMTVVRVVAPGLQPLIFGPSCVLAPDQRRLNVWREVWKIPGNELNPHPHPFP